MTDDITVLLINGHCTFASYGAINNNIHRLVRNQS